MIHTAFISPHVEAQAEALLNVSHDPTRAFALDRIDRRMPHMLLHDANLPVSHLAGRLGLSQAPCRTGVPTSEVAGALPAESQSWTPPPSALA